MVESLIEYRKRMIKEDDENKRLYELVEKLKNQFLNGELSKVVTKWHTMKLAIKNEQYPNYLKPDFRKDMVLESIDLLKLFEVLKASNAFNIISIGELFGRGVHPIKTARIIEHWMKGE